MDFRASSQPVFQKGATGIKEENRHTEGIDRPRHPECGVETEILRNGAADERPYADADIPRNIERRIGRAAAIVRRKVDEHRLKGRKQMAVTQADNQRGSVISPQIVHPRSEERRVGKECRL